MFANCVSVNCTHQETGLPSFYLIFLFRGRTLWSVMGGHCSVVLHVKTERITELGPNSATKAAGDLRCFHIRNDCFMLEHARTCTQCTPVGGSMHRVGLQTANPRTKRQKPLVSSARLHLWMFTAARRYLCTGVQHIHGQWSRRYASFVFLFSVFNYF